MFRRGLIMLATVLLLLTSMPYPIARQAEALEWGTAREVARNRLADAVVLYVGNSRALAKGQESAVDTTSPKTVPFIDDSRTLVPIRFIAEKLGAAVSWNSQARSVRITSGGTMISLSVNSKAMRVGSQDVMLEVPAKIVNNRTFLPLRAISEAFGKFVFFDKGLIVISDAKLFNTVSESYLLDEVRSWFARAQGPGAALNAASVWLKGPVTIGFTPSDAAMDLDKNVLYLVPSTEKAVYALNLETGALQKLALGLQETVRRLFVTHGKLYIAQYPDFMTNAPTPIIVMDTSSNKVVRSIPAPTRINNFVVGERGFIYTLGDVGYGEHAVTAINHDGRVFSSFKVDVVRSRNATPMEYHPAGERIYFDSYMFRFENGLMVESDSSPGDNSAKWLSPDGRLLFSQGNSVYYPDLTDAGRAGMYDEPAFAPDENRVYSGDYQLDGTALQYVGQRHRPSETAWTFYRDHHLVFVTAPIINASQVHIVSTASYQAVGVGAISYPAGSTLFKFRPADSVLHPQLPLLYLTDSGNLGLNTFNLDTGMLTELALTWVPDSLAFANGQLFVAERGKAGAIHVLDAGTMQEVRRIDVAGDPHDLVVDSAGTYLCAEVEVEDPYDWLYGRRAELRSYSTAGVLLSTQAAELCNGLALDEEAAKLYAFHRRPYGGENGLMAYPLQSGKIGHGDDLGSYPREALYLTNIHLSPDGEYVLNGSGGVFNTSGGYEWSLQRQFTDVLFLPDRGLALLAELNSLDADHKLVTVLDAATYDQLTSFEVTGVPYRLYRRDDTLICISQVNGGYLLETASLAEVTASKK